VCNLTVALSLLRYKAMILRKYKNELTLIKPQAIDVTNFENEQVIINSRFAKNFDSELRRF
jgi:hypothetical protein